MTWRIPRRSAAPKMDHMEAVLRIQSGVRGMISRLHVRQAAEREQSFLGMRPRVREGAGGGGGGGGRAEGRQQGTQQGVWEREIGW
jgi:hypothetical protein